MMGQYVADQVAAVLAERKVGTVTLTRATPGAVNPATPWIPATPTTIDVYTLDAFVKGVSADYVDETTILSTDLMVIASPKATHTLTGGAAADGAVADIVPRMTDVLAIDGAVKAIKKIQPAPAAGSAALFRIFVAS